MDRISEAIQQWMNSSTKVYHAPAVRYQATLMGQPASSNMHVRCARWLRKCRITLFVRRPGTVGIERSCPYGNVAVRRHTEIRTPYTILTNAVMPARVAQELHIVSQFNGRVADVEYPLDLVA